MEISKTKLEEIAELEPEDMYQLGYSVKIKETEMFTTSPSKIQIHKLANELPLMSDAEYIMLKESIIDQGQLIPVWLYRGKLVDGRHRLKALMELNSNVIKYTILPNNLKLSEVRRFILGTEQRRHETKTQMAIRAYFEYVKNGSSMQIVGSSFGVDKSDISRAKKIEERLGSNVLKTILKNRKAKLQNGRYYSNLKSIVQYINSIDKEIKYKKEPTEELSKKAQEIINIAFVNCDLNSLHEIMMLAKEKYNQLISK